MKFKDIKREKVIKSCKGCLKIRKDKKCEVYEKPAAWKHGCPMKTNTQLEIENKKKVNPIKKSKRG